MANKPTYLFDGFWGKLINCRDHLDLLWNRFDVVPEDYLEEIAAKWGDKLVDNVGYDNYFEILDTNTVIIVKLTQDYRNNVDFILKVVWVSIDPEVNRAQFRAEDSRCGYQDYDAAYSFDFRG